MIHPFVDSSIDQNLKSGRRIYNKAMLQPSPRVPYGVKDPSPIPSAADHEAVTKRVADFVDGVISAIVFRTELQRLGVTVTPPLEQLIRQHDLHQSVPFRDFMRVLTKPGATEIEGGESAAGLEPGEGAGPGGAKLMPASGPTKIDPSQMPACGGKTPKNAFDSTENILSWGVRGEGEEVGDTAPRTTKGEGYRPPPFAIEGQQQVGEEGGCATTGRRHALQHYQNKDIISWKGDGLLQAPSSPPPGSAGKEWTSRAMKNYGDIIGWTAQPSSEYEMDMDGTMCASINRRLSVCLVVCSKARHRVSPHTGPRRQGQGAPWPVRVAALVWRHNKLGK